MYRKKKLALDDVTILKTTMVGSSYFTFFTKLSH